MAWNGSGTYTRDNGVNSGSTTWADDLSAGTPILSTRHDTHDEDIATAINACITQNNESKPTADFAPNVTGTYDIGSSSLKWQELHLNGKSFFYNTSNFNLSGISGALIVGGDGTGQHLSIDGNDIGSKSDATTAGTLNLQRLGGTFSIGDSTNVTSATLNGEQITTLTSGTPTATTSGTTHDYTGIPSWVKRITIMVDGVSTDGIKALLIQIGDSVGIEDTGYNSGAGFLNGASGQTGDTSTEGFLLNTAGFAESSTLHGSMVLSRMNSAGTIWMAQGCLLTGLSAIFTGGSKTLTGALTQLRLTSESTPDTFDAGQFNIMYE